MAFIVPNWSEQHLILNLHYAVNDTIGIDTNIRSHIGLMTNDVSLNYSTVFEDLNLIETTVLVDGGFVASSNVIKGNPSTLSYPSIEFAIDDEETIYGYAVYTVSGSTETLLWAEKFEEGPFNIPSGGGTITVTPTLTLE